jgi:hypothetical protein
VTIVVTVDCASSTGPSQINPISMSSVTTVTVVTMFVAAALAFAQGGCKEFGVNGVSDQARNQEGGLGGYASHFGPQGEMAGAIHTSQDEQCSGS